MTYNTVSADYSAITTIGAHSIPCSNTVDLFNCSYVEDSVSAIDVFIANCKAINLIWGNSASISPEFGRLLLLGYVSAVESFFRTVIRSIINTDAKAQSDAHSYVVPYGAVLYHTKSIVADALLEGISFASEKEVKNALNKFLDVSNLPDDIKGILAEYEKICQLRHCCVHRFGKLGSQNGIVLGLEKHSAALEKPLSLDKQKLSDIASWLMSFAKTINNFMFRTLLERSVSEKNEYKIDWKWTYKNDRSHFDKLYKLFQTSKDANISPPAKELYERFRSANQSRKRKDQTKNT